MYLRHFHPNSIRNFEYICFGRKGKESLTAHKSGSPDAGKDSPAEAEQNLDLGAVIPSATSIQSGTNTPVAVPLPKCEFDYFPYGCANFKQIRIGGKYWKDNSRHIAKTVEKDVQHQIFLRPPRWGKSLLLDMLACYLDCKEIDHFDQLFGGTEILAMREQLMHNNKYHVMRLDLSIDVDSYDPKTVGALLKKKIKLSVQLFCSKYGLTFDKSLGAYGSLRFAVDQVENEPGGKVFILIDEYDRLANKLMFEKPDLYNKVVAGVSNDPFFSPIRSFFESLKELNAVRSFSVGITPIALTDASGANFIDDLTEVEGLGDFLGLAEGDIVEALHKVFGHVGPAIDPILLLIKRFYNGYYFRSSSMVTQPLFHTQLCLYFFRKLCRDSAFRQKAFLGTVTVMDMTDSNTQISENVINLLIRQRELAAILCQLSESESVSADLVKCFKLREILSAQSSRNLVVSFMRWFGLLTISSTGQGMYKIPNEVVGNAGGFLTSLENAMTELNFNVRSVIIDPSAEKVWEMHNSILAEMTTRFDNTISEGAIVGFMEIRLRAQGRYENFEVICEGNTTHRQRYDLMLVDTSTNSRLLIDYKRLRPGNNAFEQDLCRGGIPVQLINAGSVSKANDQLLQLEIMPKKRISHKNATSVEQLLGFAWDQVSRYARHISAQPDVAYNKLKKGVVIHATTKSRDDTFTSVLGVWLERREMSLKQSTRKARLPVNGCCSPFFLILSTKRRGDSFNFMKVMSLPVSWSCGRERSRIALQSEALTKSKAAQPVNENINCYSPII
jgi:hypothetical protein